MYAAWNAAEGVAGYLGHTFVMSCVRAIANTIANLPFQTGFDPENPTNHDPSSPLASLLGPATPQAPGGPNSTMSSRALWASSIVQYVVTGKWAWEQSLDPKTKEIFALWPLISAAIDPIPSKPGSDGWWSGFQYRTPFGRIDLTTDQVFYAWRHSILDTRQPESVLQAARLPISLAIACDRHMANLLKNGMVAANLVVTQGFEEEADRRAWEDQFNASFSGVDNAGKTIHAYADNDYDEETGKLVDSANVQVIPLAMKSVDAQLLEMVQQAKIDITVALGVPESLIGNASQRTYANADSEYRNFWTMTGLPMISEIQDAVNTALAPKLGKEVGWFDLSRVVALQPPTVFAPPAVKDMIDAGVITPEDVANILNLPALENPAEDVDTAPVGEEAVNSGAVGGRGYRAVHHGMRLSENWFVVHKGVNTHTLQTGVWGVEQRRERVIVPRSIRSETPQLVIDVTAKVREIHSRRAIDPRDIRIAELEAAALRYDVSPLGLKKNWVTDTGGLDPFIRAVAHALERNGRSESEAIQVAIGVIKDWAEGKGKVTAKTRAKAVAAVAHWEAQKSAAKAS